MVKPREITRTIPTSGSVGETGWLIRFFDSTFFCEWIAVSYLYKHDHPGVRDYLCNRMYTLPLSGIESYMFQICYMLVHKPSPSLDKFVIDICSKSLQISLKVHWFLMAELEDSDDTEGISKIQEKCQIAATLMGEWPTLIRPQIDISLTGKNKVLNSLRSSKEKLLSSPTALAFRSMSFSPSSHEHEPEENKILKRPFRKSVKEEPDKEGFSKKLLSSTSTSTRENADSEKDGYEKKLLSAIKDEDASKSIDKEDEEFRRPIRESRDEEEEVTSSSDGFFKRLFRDNSLSRNDSGDKSMENDPKEGFFRKLFKETKDGSERNDYEEKSTSPCEDDEKGFFKKIFKNKEEESSEYSLLRRLFRVHPENGNDPSPSPRTEKFFQKLFKDRDRSMEDSQLFGSKKNEQKCTETPKQPNEKNFAKPPLPNSCAASQYRKGSYHASLDFVQSLCETSYGLVDIFPTTDRNSALRESLLEINGYVTAAQTSGGVCFPVGKGMYRVVNIPEDEAVLLNSREKAPYLICLEVLKGETSSNLKDAIKSPKPLSKGGIPLANGDALLPKPPPWAYPLCTGQGIFEIGGSRSTSQAIDQAMTHLWEAKVKYVNVNLCIEKSSSELVKVILTVDPGVSMDDIVDQEPPRRKQHRRVPSTVAIEEVKAAALKGEAPAGLPLKGVGQESSDAQPKVTNGDIPKATDALSGELWDVKKQRIRNASVYGNLPGWDLRSVIVKSGDDCRQEHLAVQLISHFYDIFQEGGLPLWLRPYEVLVTSSYTALIETIPDTASLHSLKSRIPNITSLRDFFILKYQHNSPTFKLAQRNFVESMAGYSLVCYLLQVKDRHNGNLLLDEEGHIIHIDFGFMLSNSPGGVNFESAPFKLTRELLEVMDSDAEGIPSEFFDYFKVLCIQGFLTCRKHAERIILLVEMVQDSGFPCFKGGPKTIQNLRKRFHLSLTEEQCVSLVLSLISSSLDAWRTRQYDYYQRVLNGIL